ncbi:alpha/beta fold hydrolase [Candidatus Daviesbacteria bacterium]|nr:alpha/beta fold hydrolase [Candidatus Daviesbacteria bacterium]
MQSLFTEVSGQGKTVVLLPGMLATTAFYRPLAKILSLKHQVVSMDLLGFGRSEAPKESDYSLNEHLESINKTLEVLQIDKPFTLVGHSMGAQFFSAKRKQKKILPITQHYLKFYFMGRLLS